MQPTILVTGDASRLCPEIGSWNRLLGFATETICPGRDALSFLEVERVEAILTTTKVCGMWLTGFVTAVRQFAANQATPIIVVPSTPAPKNIVWDDGTGATLWLQQLDGLEDLEEAYSLVDVEPGVVASGTHVVEGSIRDWHERLRRAR